MSITLIENTPYNGALMLMPGSHKSYAVCSGETPDDHSKASLKKQEYGVPDDGILTRCVNGTVWPGGDRKTRFGDHLRLQCDARLQQQHHAGSALERVLRVQRTQQSRCGTVLQQTAAPRVHLLARADRMHMPPSRQSGKRSTEIFRHEVRGATVRAEAGGFSCRNGAK